MGEEQKKVLDQDHLESIRALAEGEEDVLGELTDLLKQHTPEMLAELKSAAIDKNADRVEFLAHKLKSSGGNVGAFGFVGLCRKLEDNARAGDLSNASELAQQISDEYDRVIAELERDWLKAG